MSTGYMDKEAAKLGVLPGPRLTALDQAALATATATPTKGWLTQVNDRSREAAQAGSNKPKTSRTCL